jgi:APA family basic amino acid/polyamine antiporter
MAKSNPTSQSPKGLVRQLGLFDSIMMMMGIVIGSGIFLTTGIIAEAAPSSTLVLLVWILGGLITLAGALTFAELGAAMPEAGGPYVYLRKAYGPLSGFLFGWILFLVAMGGSIAALGVGFAEYFGYFFPSLATDRIAFSKQIVVFSHDFNYSFSFGQIVALVAIILFSAFNHVGVGYGKSIQNFFTLTKIGTILIFIVLGFTAGRGTDVDFTFNPTGMSYSQLTIGVGAALVAVSWAFDGWNNINYAAGEIKNPKRNLPFALIVGTLGITVLYLLVNYIYLRALPIDEMKGVVRIAEKATSALFGRTGGSFLSAAVMISIIGALNGSIFVGARVYYAMAKDKLFFERVGQAHPRFHTPGFAIIVQAIWACLLAMTGTFEQLFTYVIFISLVFWIAATAAVFKLRKKFPDLQRPYKTWGYPVTPILFIVAASGIVISTLIAKPLESFAGMGITMIGIPAYYYWKKRG